MVMLCLSKMPVDNDRQKKMHKIREYMLHIFCFFNVILLKI